MEARTSAFSCKVLIFPGKKKLMILSKRETLILKSTFLIISGLWIKINKNLEKKNNIEAIGFMKIKTSQKLKIKKK